MILGIDTSGKTCSVALLDGIVLLGEYSVYSAKTHSQMLMPMIEKLVADCGKTFKDIRKIAVAVGPGSYTGLRIGISTAKGLAFGLGIDCIGVSTLKALTCNIFGDMPVIAVMKARANLVYAGSSCLFPDQLIDIDSLCEKIQQIDKPVTLVGDCVLDIRSEKYPLKNIQIANEQLLLQKASSVCAAALDMEDELTVSPLELKPIYLQEFSTQGVPPFRESPHT
jgi:tRNA threonylcarbamoyladenosine biosynthesis protein TsaB